MALSTFDPIVLPSANSGAWEATARLIELKFGEGYRLTAPDGLNAVELSTTLNWAAISYSTGEYIDAFMRLNVGKAFYYRLPGQKVVRKWDCKSWKVQPITGRVLDANGNDVSIGIGTCSAMAQLKERFDNVV